MVQRSVKAIDCISPQTRLMRRLLAAFWGVIFEMTGWPQRAKRITGYLAVKGQKKPKKE